MALVYRPMRPADADAVHDISVAAFDDLVERLRLPPEPQPPRAAAVLRTRHLLATDPAGAWIAERADGTAVGAALALVREGLWGLSLLVVRPEAQSAGAGRELLRLALAHGSASRGGVILASEDSRALRAYARAGFALHPSAAATGRPRPLPYPETVRAGGPADVPATEAASRAVRGAAHSPDLPALLATGAVLLLAGADDGFAVVSDGRVRLLAARDEATAQALLRAAIAGTPPGRSAVVEFITAAQGWAVEVVLEAGLQLRTGGAVFLRGSVGPFAPYLPNGAYL